MVNLKIKTGITEVILDYEDNQDNKLTFYHYQNGWFLRFFQIEGEGYSVYEGDYIKLSTNRKVKNKSKLNEKINSIIEEGNKYLENIIGFGLVGEQY